MLQRLFDSSLIAALTTFPSQLSLLLSLSIACTPALLDPLQPFLLLEDAFEYTPLSSLSSMLSLLSSHSAALSAPALFSSSPKCKLTLLRLCNGVVRRLSKTEQAEQSGRVMQLVAAMLPVEDRGGVNLTGKFNVDNRTVVEDDSRAAAGLQDDDDASMAVDGEAKDEQQRLRRVRGDAGLVDFAFYRTLWSLQSVFADPRQQLKQPDSYTAFVAALKTVLAAFDRAPPAASSSFSSLSSSSSSSAYFPKYLSGSRLLNLQLQDATFRRHLLTQCSILFHYLVNPTGDPAVTLTSTAAFLPATLPATAGSSSAAPAPLLTAFQLEGLRPLISAVMRQLAAGGDGYDSHLLRLLQEEQAWMRWKISKAPTFSRPAAVMQPPLTVDGAAKVDRRRKGRGGKAGSGGLLVMGSEALAELWSASPDNEESIRDGARVFAPELQPKLDALLEEEDDWQRRKKRAADRKLKQERKNGDAAAEASASSASPSPESEQMQEEEEEELDESQLLRHNPQRQWTLLRLLRRCDHSLFLRSEGTLDGLVEELKRRRKAREELQAKERERGEKEEKETDKEAEKEAEAEAVVPDAGKDEAKDAAIVKQEPKAEEEMETAEADGEGEPEPLELELSRPQEEAKAEPEEAEKAAEAEVEADDEDDGDSRRKRRAEEGGVGDAGEDDGDGGSRKRKGDDGIEDDEDGERRKKRKNDEAAGAAEVETETEGGERQQVEEEQRMPKLAADSKEAKMAEVADEKLSAATVSKEGVEQNGHGRAEAAPPAAVAEAPPVLTDDDAMVG